MFMTIRGLQMKKVQCVDLQRGEQEYKEIIDSIKDAGFDGCFLK